MNEIAISGMADADAIRARILTIRGAQVMLDRDLAELYGVPTKALNQAVKRNIERFPERFMFQLTKDEVSDLRSQIVTLNVGTSLRSQIVTLNKRQGQHLKYMPYAFTEQGIAMLSAVLKSATAVAVSIRIMDVFVAMRRALATLAPLLSRIEATERRQLRQEDAQARNEERFRLILDAMQDKKFPPQKVFYDGQIYDAFEQMKRFVRMARRELIIIDPYFADCVLPLVAQKRQGVSVLVVRNSRSRLLHGVDVDRFNAQYGGSLTVKVSDRFHDRFLIIDGATLIHVGASLNHLGRKCFAFSSLDKSNIPDILAKL
ncbi:MAG: ORF6N domain-containing protein [Kiritimatiellae bacterium]|nr:ORF6N domain-containing protein [Kiritimatiellia bacterium]MBR3923711.1 ORF6N domain-containing protein [Kiritimatiellia bacterium]